jgi:glycosyltransferase involved in cell wall biosynthesis
MGAARRVVAFVRFAFMATMKAARLDGDVIYATSTPLTIAIPALLASAWKKIPFVFEVRDMWPDVPIAVGALKNPLLVWLARGLEMLTYQRASHIVALAPGMRDDIIAKGIPPEKVSVIPNGCDVELFNAAPDGQSPRDEFAWLGERKLVLYAGTLGLVNGVDYLVRLAAVAARLSPETRFVVAGDGRESNAVRRLAAEAGVLDRNFFMLGPLPKRELVKWMQAADMTVALGTGPWIVWKDAVQNKFFDSLAAATPIANNFDGWQTRIAVDAGIGLMLDPMDVEDATRQLLGALADEMWLKAVPPRARALVEERFDRSKLASQLERILATVVARSAPVHGGPGSAAQSYTP